ncbi:MAG: phytoene/squalene synthase family protein [Flavobacteriales bacterium]|nr:phytoene/squalene synthase family protein [Flavobacteriales bacterium]
MQLYNSISEQTSRAITNVYSTSFASAVKMLHSSIRQDIYNIYGFVRVADEIVDTFHEYDKEFLLNHFESDFYYAVEHGISVNPVVQAFISTLKKYSIDVELVESFLKSMRMDLYKSNYLSKKEYEEYIYGSADVVGLMCLKVFVNGDEDLYQRLKPSAMKLGSAFQKVNFLRDLKSDTDILNRSYFPNIDFGNLNENSMNEIMKEIEMDFEQAFDGIIRLPETARFGVYTAYRYYKQLLKKLKRTHHSKILQSRIRVNDYVKMALMMRSYINIKLNLL